MRLGSTFVQSTIKHRDHLYFFKKLSNSRPHIAFFSGLSKCSSSCSWPKKGSRSSEQIRDERLCMEPAITDGCKSSTKHDKKSQFNGALFQLKNCIESLKVSWDREEHQVVSHAYCVVADFWPDDQKTERFSAKSFDKAFVAIYPKKFYESKILFADHLGFINDKWWAKIGSYWWWKVFDDNC